MNQYIDQLSEIQIQLLEPFTAAHKHHNMMCLNCNAKFTATPLSKTQSHKKFGGNGCPQCQLIDREVEYKLKREIFLDEIKSRGFVLLKEHDGRRENAPKLHVRNTHCGHEFEVGAKNIVARNIVCPKCNKSDKAKRLKEANRIRLEEWAKTATEWELYRSDVCKLSRKEYFMHKQFINPLDKKFGLAGKDGAHHLDHVVPIRFCFDNKIPVDLCGHHTNLQVIGWLENIRCGSKPKFGIAMPNLIREFIMKDIDFSKLQSGSEDPANYLWSDQQQGDFKTVLAKAFNFSD